jgi:magnesium chelatase family protein
MFNADIPPGRLDELAPLHPAATAVLRRHLEADVLTGRGYHRVRRVARTIADLDGDLELVEEQHVTLAVQMRVSLRISSRGRAA